ncbi:MAG: hypothetical protein NW224_05275 [Leptolyngbyaceae cyanobacterium bins.302]|nr:hypothetical protein [Leptolyngbyaceae cyanobacterium bins.302]
MTTQIFSQLDLLNAVVLAAIVFSAIKLHSASTKPAMVAIPVKVRENR